MKVMVSIGTPNQVHFFKNVIWKLEKNGHEVMTAVTDKEIALNLLNTYKFRYTVVGKSYRNIVMKGYSLFKMDYKLLKIAKRFKPDILIGHGAISATHISRLIGKPSINHEDTEHSMEQIRLYKPFVSTIITPSCFGKDLGLKQIRYEGYKELAYLHPNWFKPDSSVLDDLGLTKDDRFIIVRFSSWDASHDIGRRGFKSMDERINFIKTLEKYGKVFITSEIQLHKSLEKNRPAIPPEKIHVLLYYATMYIGEGATLASEAGVLGVPWIWISAGEMRGYLDDQEKNYGLGYCIKTPQKAIERAIELLENPNLKKEWHKKREKLLNEKIDVTAFMTWFIENYPESFKIMKKNPEYQERFK